MSERRVIPYTLVYSGGESIVTVPELEGEPVEDRPDELFFSGPLEDWRYTYSATYEPYYSRTFTTIRIQKMGGDSESVHASSYYEQLTKEEADYIISAFIEHGLGLENFTLKTDSADLIPYNPDEEEEEEDEDEDEDDWG